MRRQSTGVSLLLVVLAACSEPAALCDVPSTTTYDCEPLPAGSRGCAGGPVWRTVHSDAGQQHQDDLGLVFPAECRARIPDCSELYLGELRGFVCIEPGLPDPLAWSEGL